MDAINSTNISISEKTIKAVKIPPQYKVILKDDNFTTMEFVVFVLENIFNKNSTDAERIMLSIHQNGSEIVGTYSKEIATTKVALCLAAAKSYDFPLACLCEPVDE